MLVVLQKPVLPSIADLVLGNIKLDIQPRHLRVRQPFVR
jgi:hypothetical protein